MKIADSLRQLLVPIDSVRPLDRNPRKHGQRSIDGIKDSLKAFGQTKPIVIDQDGHVVAGNGLLQAAKSLGWTSVAAARVDLTPDQAKAYSIADNRTAELSAWDDETLASLLGELDADIRAVLGFNDAELAKQMHASSEATEDDAVAPPAIAATIPGDMWQMGEHRLLCGSSLEAADVDRVMAGETAHACITDPPYLVDYTGKRPGKTGKDWTGVYREVDIKDAKAFFGELFANMAARTLPGAAFYCWHAHRRYPEIQAAWEAAGIVAHQQIVWVKPSSVFGASVWHYRHEPCLMGWREGAKCRHDGSHEHDTVWEVDWSGSAKISGSHPTQKPVELVARPIRKHTKRGEILIEPFSGSGTCIIACEQTGRKCRAIELEPNFVDAAIMRWERFTGKHATLIESAGKGKRKAKTAQTFEEVCKARTGKPPCRPSRSGPADNPDVPA